MNEFFEIYDELSQQYPLYMELKHMRSGIPRWRLQVFGKNMARTSGDAGIICVECETRAAVFAESAVKLKAREKDLAGLKT